MPLTEPVTTCDYATARARAHTRVPPPFRASRTSFPATGVEAVRRATGLAGFHVHQMRHTFACQWLVRGGTLAALQQLLGHASIVTTQRYAKLSDEAVMREAQRLQSPLGAASVTQVSPGDGTAERQA